MTDLAPGAPRRLRAMMLRTTSPLRVRLLARLLARLLTPVLATLL